MARKRRTVLIIGGGITGISTAWELNKRGWDVTIVEKRSVLGGRLTSYRHSGLPTPFDNGPHLFLDAYVSALRLFRELGIDHCFEFPWPLEVPYAISRFRSAGLTAWPLPSPLNFAWGLLAFKPLDVKTRLQTTKTILRLMREPVEGRISIQNWLQDKSDSEAIRIFWEPLVSATTNASMSSISVKSLQEVFRSGFCSPLRGGRLGYCRYPFRSVFHDRVVSRLEAQGITVLLNETVAGAETSRNRISWISFNQGGKSYFDQIVAALPPASLRRFVDTFIAGGEIKSQYLLDEWNETPISNLYLWAKQRPLLDAVTCTPEGPFDFVFDYGRIWGDVDAPICLMFGQRTLVDLKEAGITRELVLNRLSDSFITLKFVDWIASRFSQEVRAIPVKPMALWGKEMKQTTAIENLTVAGDWLDPELPATVEAGARTGSKAAEILAFS